MLHLDPAATERLRGLWARAIVVAQDETLETVPLPDEAECVPQGVTLDGLKDHEVAAGYRTVSWSLGIDPTKHRPAGEALARRILGGKPFPQIHPLVDAYNRASAETLTPLGAYDMAHTRTPILVRPARGEEQFHGIGRDPEPLQAGRIVYAAADEQVAGVMLWRDALATRIRPDTEQALVLAVGAEPVAADVGEKAMQRAADLAGRVGFRWDGVMHRAGPLAGLA